MSVHWGGRGAGHVSRWSAGGYPLVMNFIPAALDARITFTRASVGTFLGSNGFVQSAAINVARFPYNSPTLVLQGFLVEPQRTNIAPYSEQFNDASWTKTRATISANAVAAPDSVVSADKLVEDATAANTHFTNRIITASASTAYTQSVFIKAAERTKGQLQMVGNGGGSTVNFDLTAITATATGAYGSWTAASAAIVNFGNGWYRVTNSVTTNVGLTAINYGIYLADASGNATYTGNGTSGFYIWGAQLEASASATSYIQTVAASVIRSADSAALTIPSGVAKLRYVFDNDTVQDVAVTAGAYTIPTSLNRSVIKAILGLAY